MNSYPAIRIEGGLLGPDILDQLVSAELPGQKPADFGLESKRNLTDEIAAVYQDAKEYWGVFRHRCERLSDAEIGTTVTRDAWMLPFLGLLGFELRYNQKGYDIDGLTFAISHRAGESEDSLPVHVVGLRQELGRVPALGRPRLAPHSLVQEYLNRTEHVWGLVSNGLTLRLLRDCTFIRRQAYIEFDLQQLFEEPRFPDFRVLYLLLHRTRLPRSFEETTTCLLEQYYSRSVEQGGRVREHLRDGVEACIQELANGFLRHRENTSLRDRLKPEYLGPDRISPEILYRQLLNLVYRFLFLLVSEERGLISPDPVYREHYSISRLRKSVDNRAAYSSHDDIWRGLRVLWRALGDEKLAQLLNAAPLNGDLFAQQTLDGCAITNRDLLTALWRLVYYEEKKGAPSRRVNYAALDVEELGSVYESLLEFHPAVTHDARGFPEFNLVYGSERKTTGSYYTPPQLVNELIRSALEPVVKERLKGARKQAAEGSTNKQQQNDKYARLAEQALLAMRVCDPACGSGHFLLAAARRIGKELARVRSGEEEPAPERVRESVRDVIAHCIYGVDKNPLAVDLCRVALWLESHYGEKPLTFLDHHIRCGDSLIGVFDLEVLGKGIPDAAYKALEGDEKEIAKKWRKVNKEQREKGSGLFVLDPKEALAEFSKAGQEVDDISDDSPEAVRRKKQLYLQSQDDLAWKRMKNACDMWCAAFFQPFVPKRQAFTTEILLATLSGAPLVEPHVLEAIHIAERQRFFHWPLEFPEVFAGGGFNVVLGNPPFMGGLKISEDLGRTQKHALEELYHPFTGRADLCAAFFRKGYSILQEGGRLGLIATKTISQGETRDSGLAILLRQRAQILAVTRFVDWPGAANVEVTLVTIGKGTAETQVELDGEQVGFIASRLDTLPDSELGTIRANVGVSFQGSIVLGSGFVISNNEASNFIQLDPKNREVLFPYYTGEDLNTSPSIDPSRWVIQFDERTESEAQSYSAIWQHVLQAVYPERAMKDASRYPRMVHEWWKHWNNRHELYARIKPLARAFARSRVSERHMLAPVPTDAVFSDAVVVFAFEDSQSFALIQSDIHDIWLRREASTMRTDIRYTPKDCFLTFPYPPLLSDTLASIGEEYLNLRMQIMSAEQIGLTKLYNKVYDEEAKTQHLRALRDLHVSMSEEVLACYNWTDIRVTYQFLEDGRGRKKFSLTPNINREIITRLASLNNEQHNE